MTYFLQVLWLTSFILLGATPALSRAQGDGVKQLVDKYVAWRGGDAFQALQSTYMAADVEMHGLTGPTRGWRARSGSSRDELDLGETHSVQVVHRGRGWRNIDGLTESLGALEVEDVRRDLLVEFGDALTPGLDRTVTREADERRDSARLAVLRVSFEGRDYTELLLDPDSGALHAIRVRRDGRTELRELADWRMVRGVRMPFTKRHYRANGKLNAVTQVRTFAIDLPISPTLLTPPASDRTLSFAAGASTTGPIRFNFVHGNRIYVPATVNGRPVEVLLDSGADGTVLDKRFAESIGRAKRGASVASGSGGEQEAGYARDIRISIGNLTLHAPSVTVVDLADVSARLGIPLPVILGKEIFLQAVVDIDPSARTIAFHERGHFKPPANAVQVPLEPLGTLRSVPVSVEGRPDAPMIFDLGNGGYMSLTPAFWQSQRLLEGRLKSSRLAGAVGGERVNQVATLSSLRFAGVTFENVPAEFASPQLEIDSDRRAGNVGMPLLGRFRLLIDFMGDRLDVVPLPDRISAPFPRDRAGVRTVYVEGKLQVRHVSEGSPAHRAGLSVGEAIAAIDGQAVHADSATAHAGWNFASAGTKVLLTMDDGSTREVVLADYF